MVLNSKLFPFPHGVYDVREINNTLKSIPQENIKLDFTANDITMETSISIDSDENKLLEFNKKIFLFHKILRFKITDHTKGT